MSRAGWQLEREHAEPVSRSFTPFALDRHRIINCTAFRRLEHKTQVFAPSLHDHFRTRLTHTLEVANIARTLAKILNADTELAEAISLAHDLGHPPFGHAGEAALDDVMRDCGGFNHNAHSIRVVEYLEHPIPAFRGLNLTRAVREGLRAHETAYDRPESGAPASTEAQIASWSDRIAYDLHDLEDGIGAGFVSAADAAQLEWWRLGIAALPLAQRNLPVHAVRRPVLDVMLNAVLADLIANAPPAVPATSSAHAGHAGVRMLAPSPAVAGWISSLEAFVGERVYRHPDVLRTDRDGQRMIGTLFQAYRTDPSSLPDRFARRAEQLGVERVVCDYIAGMTDRFARRAWSRLAAD